MLFKSATVTWSQLRFALRIGVPKRGKRRLRMGGTAAKRGKYRLNKNVT